jgi:hypothetical protein
MRKIAVYLILFIAAVIAFFAIKNWWDSENEREKLISETALIQKQITNTSKLVVTEVKYARVIKRTEYGSWFKRKLNIPKTALIVIEPDVQISYDLKQLQYELDSKSKTIFIKFIPKPELRINPNITYYDIDDHLANRFNANDYNNFQKKIVSDLRKEILKDPVMKNAENRLLSELSNIYILSSSMGWKLVYNDEEVNSTKEMNSVLFKD